MRHLHTGTGECTPNIPVGKINIFGDEYSVNEAFRQEATQLSDDFDIDEIMAATFLLSAQDQSQKMDRTPLQSARFLFHTRRKNILDSIRLIFTSVLDRRSEPESDARELLERAAQSLISSGTATEKFPERCISAMGAVRRQVQNLNDKVKHVRTLGMALDPGFKEDVELQIRFLRDQHELLAIIVYYAVKIGRPGVAELKRLLGVFKGLDRYDVFTAHYILPLYTLIGTLCGPDSSLGFEDSIQLHRAMLKDYKENHWNLRYCQAAVMVWWLSEFNGICNDPPPGIAPSKDSLDYHKDIQEPTRLVLRDGGLEFIMGLAADLGPEPRLNAAKEDLHRFLQARVPPLDDLRSLLLPGFMSLLVGQLELLIDGFICNMAGLLQVIKTAEEEDDIMDMRTYDYELERFFLTVHYIYNDRPDAGVAFWSDPESNLYGFLQWAARNQTPFMVSTFCYMLAALSSGRECAALAHKFLLDDALPGANRNRRGESLTWAYVFKHVRKYLGELEKLQKAFGPHALYRSHQLPPLDAPDPAPHLSMELDGMLRLIARVAADSPEAREWLTTGNPQFDVLYSLFDLLNLQASTQLWDSIFCAITALLTGRDEAFGDKVWRSLDNWALGTAPPPAPQPPGMKIGSLASGVLSPLFQPGPSIFELIVQSVHPAEAFARLLARLVDPPQAVAELRDALPFPENLGSASRTTGMLPYVDLVLDTIFSNTTAKNLPPELPPSLGREETASEQLSRAQYRRFRPALQLSCLHFIYACLTSFNEDLLDMAHRGLSVDGGIRSSSLLTYARLHPFGRVMEYLLTEKCLNVFFEILQLGVQEMIETSKQPPPPVADTVLYALMILDLAIQMQPTYFRVVRPFVKQDDTSRRTSLTSNSFERVEQAVHYHLATIVHIALCIGNSQQDIVLASIKLLEKFAVSPDCTAESGYGRPGPGLPVDWVLGAVQQSDESRRIIYNFIHQWEFPGSEEQRTPDGDSAGGLSQFPLRLPILRFLDNTLASQPNATAFTLAHLVLGFEYDSKYGIQLSVGPGGVGTGVSLFHCILAAALDAKDYCTEATKYVPEYCELKSACFAILNRLWSAPSTSSDVLFILRANKVLFEGFVSEVLVRQSSQWGGVPIGATSEFFDRGASAFCDFLKRRTSLFEYAALEIRQVSSQGASTMVQRYLETLLGTTVLPGTSPVSNLHILDLVDFLEFTFPAKTRLPPVKLLGSDTTLQTFQEEDPSGVVLFELVKVAEYLQIRRNVLLRSGAFGGGADVRPILDKEIGVIRSHLFCENQLRRCQSARLQCLTAWANLVMIMLEDCDMERMSKTLFILQALQTILPKMEAFCVDDVEAGQVLSSLAHSLISHLDFKTAAFGAERSSDLCDDRLHQLFRISLQCIQSNSSTSRLRQDFYNVALCYLNGMAAVSTGQSLEAKRYSIQTVKASGDRLLEMVCNDAYAGEGTCKVVALLLLQAFVAVAGDEGSAYVVDVLMRHNFLVVFIDSIKGIASDMANARPEGALHMPPKSNMVC